jgi:hypothetical protein
MADPDGMDRPDVNMDALKSEIRRQLINQKVRTMERCGHNFHYDRSHAAVRDAP